MSAANCRRRAERRGQRPHLRPRRPWNGGPKWQKALETSRNETSAPGWREQGYLGRPCRPDASGSVLSAPPAAPEPPHRMALTRPSVSAQGGVWVGLHWRGSLRNPCWGPSSSTRRCRPWARPNPGSAMGIKLAARKSDMGSFAFLGRRGFQDSKKGISRLKGNERGRKGDWVKHDLKKQGFAQLRKRTAPPTKFRRGVVFRDGRLLKPV